MDEIGTEVERLRGLTEGLEDGEFLRVVTRELSGTVVFSSSFGAEDQVLTHLLLEQDRTVPIVTLDTGRLPQETYDLMEESRRFFGVEIHVFFPDAAEVEELVRAGGPNLFYNSIADRKSCCNVRKVKPLKRALAGHRAWITGMRRSQSVTRTDLSRIEVDEGNRMIKINPLIEWSRDEIWDYIRTRGLPYNKLHDKGFPSIGCLPCTRAVLPGEDERAGRWWWELPEQRECGIHIKDGRAVRVNPEYHI